MVTQVTLGNFFSTSNGKNVLGGAGGSGLDTQTLVKALVAAKSQPATNDQVTIKANDAQSAALTSFQNLLSTFQSAADALRNPPGVGNAGNNVFQFTTGSVSGGGSAYVGITATPGASVQSYGISNITSLAQSAAQTTGTFTVATADTSIVSASPIGGTTKQFAPGTITINSQGITLHEGDSLNVVAAEFNAVKATTGITATVIQTQSGHYQMSFAAINTGTAYNFDLTNSGTVSDPSGVLSNLGIGTAATQTSGPYTLASAGNAIVSASPIGGTAHQFAPGTFSVHGQPITLTEGESLTNVANAFNAVKTASGVGATVVDHGDGTFSLAFASTKAGPSHNFNLTDAGTVTDLSGVLTGAGIGSAVAGTSTAVAGKDAQFNLNGVTITRSGNTISDVVSGVTFNLLQKTTDSTQYTASVAPDTTTVQNAIVAYVNAYNALRSFAAQQIQLNSDGTYATTAVLANNQTFRTIMSDVSQQVTSQVAGIGTNQYSSLAAVGITLTTQPANGTNPAVTNILTVNDGQLSTALATNFTQVSNLFGFNMTSDNTDVKVFKASNSLAVNAFSLNVNPGSSIFTATYTQNGSPVTVNLTATALPGSSGYSLTGQAGTALAGLVLVYASTNAGTANIKMTQGIADITYNSANSALAQNTGTIPLALQQLANSDTQLNKDIAQINQQVSQYQTQLLQQFAALEQAVSQVNTLLSSLNASQIAESAAAQG